MISLNDGFRKANDPYNVFVTQPPWAILALISGGLTFVPCGPGASLHRFRTAREWEGLGPPVVFSAVQGETTAQTELLKKGLTAYMHSNR